MAPIRRELVEVGMRGVQKGGTLGWNDDVRYAQYDGFAARSPGISDHLQTLRCGIHQLHVSELLVYLFDLCAGALRIQLRTQDWIVRSRRGAVSMTGSLVITMLFSPRVPRLSVSRSVLAGEPLTPLHRFQRARGSWHSELQPPPGLRVISRAEDVP